MSPRAYDVYGFVRSGDSGASSQKICGSLGHASEDNTGLIYMRARYMDPALGRFVSEDPGRNGTNWYVYCENNPVNKIDRIGRVSVPYMADFILSGLILLLVGVAWAEGE